MVSNPKRLAACDYEEGFKIFKNDFLNNMLGTEKLY